MDQQERLLRLREVKSIVGWSGGHIYSLIRAGKFPKPVKRGCSSAWVKSEIDAYVARVIAEARGEEGSS